MTTYIFEREDGSFHIFSSTQTPPGHKAVVPSGVAPEDYPFTKTRISEEDGSTEVYVDSDMKEAALAEEQVLVNVEARRCFESEVIQALKDSDWTHLSDVAISSAKKAAWATYRQALRDIINDLVTDPAEVTWPTKPA